MTPQIKSIPNKGLVPVEKFFLNLDEAIKYAKAQGKQIVWRKRRENFYTYAV